MARRSSYNLIFLAVAFGMMFVYVILFEIPGDLREQKVQTVMERPFFLLESKALRAITISALDRMRLRKEKKRWQIVAPRRYKTEQRAVAQFIKQFKAFSVVRTLPRGKKFYAQYGLKGTRYFIKIGTTKTNYLLRFGKNISLGDEKFTYVALGDRGEVKLAETHVAEQLKKRLTFFRDKDIFAFEQKDVAQVAINYKGRSLRFVRSKKGWHLKGISAPLDQQKVDKYFANFYLFRADQFVSESADSAIYGVRPWKNYIEIVDLKGRKKRLSFGRTKRGDRYCAVSGSQAVYSVMQYKFEWLNKQAKDFFSAKSGMKINKKR